MNDSGRSKIIYGRSSEEEHLVYTEKAGISKFPARTKLALVMSKTIELNKQQASKFIDALLNPPNVNTKLRKAAKQYVEYLKEKQNGTHQEDLDE